MMLTAVNIPALTRAETVTSEREEYCEKVIEAGSKYIKKLEHESELQKLLNAQLTAELDFTKDQLDKNTPAWYEKPVFVIGATTIAIGTIVVIAHRALK